MRPRAARSAFRTWTALALLLAVQVAAAPGNPGAKAAGDLFEGELRIEPFTREGCLDTVETVRRKAEDAGQIMQVGTTIDDAELLCRAGDYGQAEVLLKQVWSEIGRLN